MTRKILYVLVFGLATVMISSCGSSNKSASMRKIERHAKKNPVDRNGNPVASGRSGSRKVRKAIEAQEKRQAAIFKEAEKNQRDAITRHRSVQTQETRDRMDNNLKASNKRHRAEKDFFVARWFQPSNDIDKIEKRRAKETQKRMAATLKQAEKNNKDFGVSTAATNNQKKSTNLPSPKDMPHGGGGAYKEGNNSRNVSASDYQHGGGGIFQKGKSKNQQKASDFQHGGGGNMSEKGFRLFAKRK